LRDSPGPVRTVPFVVLSSSPLLPHRDAGETRPPRVQTTRRRRVGKARRRCQVETREKAVCATRPAIARAAAVTSPGDMIAPGETPDRRSLAISDDARL
jgi:hypothetical protein